MTRLTSLVLVTAVALALSPEAPAAPSADTTDAVTTFVYVEPGLYAAVDTTPPLYLADGQFWTELEDGWWRTTDLDDTWTTIAASWVPIRVRAAPPGRYLSYQPTTDDVLVRADQVQGRHDGHGARPPASRVASTE